MNKAFNKGLAVQRLCQPLGVPLEDTVAFWDSLNDLELLQTAGCAACMGNGSAGLKEIADLVCPTVGEDGLYRAFEKLNLI